MGMGGFRVVFFSIFFSLGFLLDIIFRFPSSGGNVVLNITKPGVRGWLASLDLILGSR